MADPASGTPVSSKPLTCRYAGTPAQSAVPTAFRTGPMVVTDPILVCLDCGEAFAWSDSPDDDRCPWCAEQRANNYFRRDRS